MAATSNAALRKVTLNAARSKEFPEGSIRHGYDFVAPLTDDGHIDLEAWKQHRGECFAHRFWGDEPAMRGLLVHRAGGRGGSTWAFEWKAGTRDEGGGRLPLRRPRLQGRRVRVGARGGGRASDLPGGERRQPVSICPEHRSAELAKERDQRGVDLARPLLLRPMAAAGQHDRFRELGDEQFQVRDQLIHPRKFDDEVAVARDVKRRHRHLRAGEGREKLPVAVDVAIPVEPAAEARAGEFSRIEIDVRLGEPRRAASADRSCG